MTFDKVIAYVKTLQADSAELNADVRSSYPSDQWLAIWSEGGEWPAYSEAYRQFAVGDKRRELTGVGFVRCGSVDIAKDCVVKAFDGDQDMVGLSMDCGTGKSTSLIDKLHTQKFGQRMLVVQPSLAVARQLVSYKARPECVYARTAQEFPGGRGVVYTNAGATLDLIFRSQLDEDDVVVIDEAHSCSMAHYVLERILETVSNKLILLTASTSTEVKAARGVKVAKVSETSTELSDALAREDNQVIVGVMPNMSYATPAACLVGATLPIKLLYDTGLRPEPRVVSGQVRHGERVAVVNELLQSAGRLGRCQQAGKFYYNPDVRAMKPKGGLSLYDVLQKSILAAVGFDEGIEPYKAVSAWKKSGVVGPGNMEKAMVASGVPEVNAAGVDSVADTSDIDSTSGLSTRNVSETFVDAPTKSSAAMKSAHASDGGELSADSRRVSFDLSRIHESLASLHSEPAVATDEDDSVQLSTSRRSSGVKPYKAHLRVKRHSSSSSSSGRASMQLDSCVREVATGSEHKVAPDSRWRPFRRYAQDMVVHAQDQSLRSPVVALVRNLDKASRADDIIYPCLFPKLDENIASPMDIQDARLVLSGDRLAGFTELELMSVMVMWNRTVRSLGSHHMPTRHVSQFIDYFRRYCEYEAIPYKHSS